MDAYYAALYGLTRDELRYIIDPNVVYGSDFPGETFRVLKEGEIRKYGEYRTMRLVLEAWDRLSLVPRNREGCYPVEPQSSATGLTSLEGIGSVTGGSRPGVQEQRAAYPSWSAGLPGKSSPVFGKAARKARRTLRSTMPGDTGWQDALPTLPGMPPDGQLSFGDLASGEAGEETSESDV